MSVTISLRLTDDGGSAVRVSVYVEMFG